MMSQQISQAGLLFTLGPMAGHETTPLPGHMKHHCLRPQVVVRSCDQGTNAVWILILPIVWGPRETESFKRAEAVDEVLGPLYFPIQKARAPEDLEVTGVPDVVAPLKGLWRRERRAT